jgi:hypothetical protein
MIKKLTTIIILFTPLFVLTQENYPQSYFISPLDIPLNLSGTFGELRADHFHSGIDIRTGEVEGLKVYAIADGYISRINVSSGGYGKALYITHPNGYVSVYGHLQRFEGVAANYVKSEQYRRESFEVDLYPETGRFKITKGEVIALSGDSGGSGGPHLHFEIRDASTEKPINPLLFGYKIADISSPVIYLLKIYCADSKSLIRNKKSDLEINVVGSNGLYKLTGSDTLLIYGKVYLGIQTIDLFNNGNNKNGVYSISLMIDSNIVFQQHMKTFSFDETRYINSLIDYPERIRNNRWIQKSFIQPNNRLSIYSHIVDNGIIEFDDNRVHKMIYKVTDAAGNESSLKFHIKGSELKADSVTNNTLSENIRVFSYKQHNRFETENFFFEVPGDALYDTLIFTYALLPAIKNSVSAVHKFHNNLTPLHNYCDLAIRPDSLPLKIQSKALIIKLDDEKGFVSTGGEFSDGYIKTKIREFGNYCVAIDTIAPLITPVNITNKKSITQQSTLKVKITDELSGIAAYRGRLNGKWILMDYDAKNDLLTYIFDDLLVRGENIFELTVTDKKNNTSNYQSKLIY